MKYFQVIALLFTSTIVFAACSSFRAPGTGGTLPTPTPISCTHPELILPANELSMLRAKIDEAVATQNLAKIIDLTAPDTTIDCTKPKEVEANYPMLDPQLCVLNARNNNLALYSVGVYPSGLASTKSKVKEILSAYSTKYGPFVFDTISKPAGAPCGETLEYKNKSGVKFTVDIYQRVDGKVIVTPTTFPQQ